MDLLPLGFLFLIVVVSGAIAYWSDQFGKKLGKKRLSFGGMRPRHVASIGTVLLGVSVSLLTILFVAFASRDVREWIVRGRRAITELDAVQSKLEARQTELQKTQGQLSDSRRAIQGLQSELKKGSARLETQHSALAQLTARKAALDVKVSSFAGLIRRQNVQIAQAKHRLGNSESQLRANQQKLVGLNRMLASSSHLLTLASQDRNRALLEKRRIDSQNRDLESKIRDQKDLLTGMQDQLLSMVSQRNQAQQDLSHSKADLADIETKLVQEQIRLGQVQQASEYYATEALKRDVFIRSTVLPSRIEPLIYQYGEEIVRLPVPAKLTPDEAQNALTTLMRMARVRAEERGAKPHDAGDRHYDVADIYDREDPKTGQSITADDLRKALLRQITGRAEEQVLLAYASLNSFRGEPLALELGTMPNPIVYRKNEVIAEAKIDGERPENLVLQQLSNFVGVTVRDKAQRDHMIPMARREESFGALSTDQVLSLLLKVKATNRWVRLQALAEADTHAADALRLEFRIR